MVTMNVIASFLTIHSYYERFACYLEQCSYWCVFISVSHPIVAFIMRYVCGSAHLLVLLL